MRPHTFLALAFLGSFTPIFAGDFKFTTIEVEVEASSELTIASGAPAVISAVPTRVRIADARVVSQKLTLPTGSGEKEKEEAPIVIQSEVAPVDTETSAQPQVNGRADPDSEPARPMLVAPLQDVDLSSGEEIALTASSPFAPPYVGPLNTNNLDLGLLPARDEQSPPSLPMLDPSDLDSGAPRATPVSAPIPLSAGVRKALPLLADPNAAPNAASNVASVTAPRVSPQELAQEEASYYSELETDTLLNGAGDTAWRFMKPVVAPTW